MAITLTYDYQRISTIGTTYGEIRSYAKVNSQDKTLNKSYYNLKLTYYLRQWIETSSANASLDGSTRGYGYTRFNAGETAILEVSREIQHNEDGSSPIKNVASSWSASFGGGGNTSADIIMPKIDRLAYFIGTLPTQITDESVIQFSYANPVGFKVKPTINITQESTSGVTGDYITDNPYTWDWLNNEADKARIYDTVRNSVDATASLRLLTYDQNDNYLGLTAAPSIPFKIVNANPTISITTEEQNEKVKAIVGNKKIAVNNVSVLRTTATVSAKKGSEVIRVLIQGKDVASPYVTDVPVVGSDENYIIGASVTDRRQLTSSASPEPYTLVQYTPVSIENYSFKRENPTSSQIILSADVNYWQVTVNNVANVPKVSYSTDGKVFNEIPSANYSIDEESHKLRIYNYDVPTLLDYREQGTYYLKVEDKFTEDNENQLITKGIPTFEAGKNDFQVNGDLFIADEHRENPKNVLDTIDETVNNAIKSSYMLVNSPDRIIMTFGTPYEYVKVPLENVIQSSNDKFTLVNNSVKIGKNVSKIKIMAKFNWFNYELSNDKSMTILKNDLETGSIAYVNYSSEQLYCDIVGFTILDVSEGDLISLGVSSGSAGNCTLFGQTSILIEDLK